MAACRRTLCVGRAKRGSTKQIAAYRKSHTFAGTSVKVGRRRPDERRKVWFDAVATTPD